MPSLRLLHHSVFYETHGHGPAVVLLHHATGCLRDWRRQIGVLAGAGFRTIAYDRHGFGRADALASWGLDYHQAGVDELLALLNALQVERAALVGHSDGATISLMSAAQYPDRIASVVAESPHMWIEPDWLETGFETFRQTVGASSRFGQAMQRDHGDRATQVVERWRHRWLDPAFRSWDQSACLEQVRCPVLVIHGSQDVFFPIAHSRTIAARLPNSWFWLFPSAGHTPHLEATDDFNQHVTDFLRVSWPRSDA